MDEPTVYLEKMTEVLERLDASEQYLKQFRSSGQGFELKSASLQLRKAMEAIAFAAIAPNKKQYEAIRKAGESPADFAKDWQADSIFLALTKVNADFYPDPLLHPVQTAPGNWHYGKPESGYMNRKAFETLYKRLGKFLHADNPWGRDKGWTHLAQDLPDAITKIRALIAIHRTIIRASDLNGVWIVEAPSDGTPPRMIRATADGEFIAT
jgi:hypothetical protein